MDYETSPVRDIKKCGFITMFILIICHIIIVGYTFYAFKLYIIFIYLSMWSFLFCSVYLIGILIIDSKLYFTRSTKFEPINNFFRNFFAGVVYPLCYAITLIYWGSKIISYLGSPREDKNEGTIYKFLKLYYYLITAVIMTLDLILTKRKNNFFELWEFVGITTIYVIYEIALCIDKYHFGQNPYDYMLAISPLEMGIHGLVNYAILIACYFLYILLRKVFNKNNLIQLSRDEGKNLISNESEEGLDL